MVAGPRNQSRCIPSVAEVHSTREKGNRRRRFGLFWSVLRALQATVASAPDFDYRLTNSKRLC